MPVRRPRPLTLALATLCLGACTAPEAPAQRVPAPALNHPAPANVAPANLAPVPVEAARGATASLTREDFDTSSRDPFAPPRAPTVEAPRPSARDALPVHVAGVPLDDLSLIAVVRGRGNTPGHALFVAPDRRSHSVPLGELFSRDAVRLASLEGGSVVIEGVDPEGQAFDREIALRR